MAGNRIRVLHVSRGLGLGGTEKVLQLFLTHLDRERFAPAVATLQDGPRRRLLTEAGVPVHVVPDIGLALARVRPHIAHVHRAGWPDPELLRPVRRARVPAVVETNVFGRQDTSPDAACLDLTLFVSRFCARRYAAVHGVPAEPPRFDALYNPVDTDFFAACPGPSAAPVVGRVSRPDPGKWSALALDFLPHLAALVPDFRYDVIGGIPAAKAFVRDHGLSRHVRFLPQVNTDAELARFYSGLTLLAHANDTGESFGLAIAEAMACGLPVITHPAEGLRDNAQLELVDHGLTGFVASSAEDYARHAAFLLTHPEEARAMGARGREKAARLFRAQDVVRRLEAMYLALLERKGIPPA